MSRVLVPLAQGCEELEAVTIIDLLVRAGIEVTTAGLNEQPVIASRGTRIIPDTTLDQVMDQSFDMIVLPGGQPGASNLRDDSRVQQLLKCHAAEDKYVAAICAAPSALAAAGLLDRKTATAFPGTLEAIKNPAIKISAKDVEIDGKIITSRGPGTAMDFALTLIELLAGKAQREKVNTQLVRNE
jgi:4-methyl-5(b-hydroxyethyl)-thiazole monophosphate biosynthesis